jgi:hypothetical protein
MEIPTNANYVNAHYSLNLFYVIRTGKIKFYIHLQIELSLWGNVYQILFKIEQILLNK